MKIRDIFTEQKSSDDYTAGGGISSADPLGIGGRDVSGRLSPMQIDVGLGGSGKGGARGGIKGTTPATAVLRGRETPAQARSREAGERAAASATQTSAPKTKYTRDTDLPIVGQNQPAAAPAAQPSAPAGKPTLRDKYNQWKYKETDPLKIEKIKQEKYATAQAKATADLAKAQAAQAKAATPMSLKTKAGIAAGAAAAGTAADYLTTPADQEWSPSLSGTFIKGPARAYMGPDPRQSGQAQTDGPDFSDQEEIIEPPETPTPPSGSAAKPSNTDTSSSRTQDIEHEVEPETAAAEKIKARGGDLWKESKLSEEVTNKGFYVNYGDRAKVGGSRNWRNNNPGNIEYGPFAKEMGAIGSDGRFAIFPDSKTGYEAAHKLLTDPKKGYHGKTIAQNIQRWAPKYNNKGQIENDPNAYINMMRKSGFDPNAKYSDLTPEQQKQYLNAINNIEGGRPGFVVPTGKIQQNLNLTGRLGKSQQAALPSAPEIKAQTKPTATTTTAEPAPVATKGSKIADYMKSKLGITTPSTKPSVTTPAVAAAAVASTAQPKQDTKIEPPKGQAAKPTQTTATSKDATTTKKPAEPEKSKEVKPSDSTDEFKFDPIAFKKVEPAADIVSANPQIKGVMYDKSATTPQSPNKDWTKEIDKNALSVQAPKERTMEAKYIEELDDLLYLAGKQRK